MVVVLDYNKSESELLNKLFAEYNIDYKYSLAESHIINSDKIILPNPIDFNAAYRKMQMSNLFSFLRLMQKPILGINNGFCLMCDDILDKKKCGLGFFKIDSNSKSSDEESQSNLVNGKLQICEKSKLVNERLNNSTIKFDVNIQTKDCEFSSSTILYNEEIYSLTCEYKNYYSLDLILEENMPIAKSIISNFLTL